MKNRIRIICVAFLCSAGFIARSQTALTNTGVLYISGNSDILYAAGDFTNNSGAALTNNGQLYIKGTVSNAQSSMPAGTGTLRLIGTSAQSVNGTQPFKTYNLITDNTAGITLNNDLSVTGAHTFTNGLIGTSSTPNYLIYEAGSSYSGDGDAKHVTGWVKKNGNTNFTFPVGDAAYERTIALSNLGSSSEFNVKYNTPTSNIHNLSSPLVQVKGNEYWQVDRISGTSAQVTLNWNHAKVAMDNVLVADILASNYSGGLWVSRGGTASGTVTTTGTITSSSTSVFGAYTLGYKTYPIPLHLLSFTADRRAGISYLKWITENEYNVDHFEIQRSIDGVVYFPIGTVVARNSGSLQYYSYNDNIVLHGLAYYRLKSIDIDGRFSYSSIAVVSDNELRSDGVVAVSPAHSQLTVFNRTGTDGVFTYYLYTANGQLLSNGLITMNNNSGAALPLPATARGVCMLEMIQGAQRFRQTILVQ